MTTNNIAYLRRRRNLTQKRLADMIGTNTGPWGEMPATGKVMDVMGCDVMRFENGKAAEHWGYMEEAKMMMQLGLMPPPAAPEKK